MDPGLRIEALCLKKAVKSNQVFNNSRLDGRILPEMNTAKDMSVLSVVTLEGDGIGAEIMAAACRVLDAAVEKAFQGSRRIHWQPYPAGSQAFKELGQPLPVKTVKAMRSNRLALKGPLTTPVGGGMQSLNVLLRQQLDLYVCQRPVRSIPALPSPLANTKPDRCGHFS